MEPSDRNRCADGSEIAMSDIDQQQLLTMTPNVYLRRGFRWGNGERFPELNGIWATAASLQMENAEASPQELAFTLDALREVALLHRPFDSNFVAEVTQEAIETVRGMIEQPNNRGIVRWIADCRPAIRNQRDFDDWLSHMQAVVRQYGTMIAMKGLK
jgi:hypothetical protein